MSLLSYLVLHFEINYWFNTYLKTNNVFPFLEFVLNTWMEWKKFMKQKNK